MSIASPRLTARLAGLAAALVAAALPVQGSSVVKTGQVGSHMTAMGQRAVPAVSVRAPTNSHSSNDLFHHWPD